MSDPPVDLARLDQASRRQRMLRWLDVALGLGCLVVYLLNVAAGAWLLTTSSASSFGLGLLMVGVLLPPVVYLLYRVVRSRPGQRRVELLRWVDPDRSRSRALAVGVLLALCTLLGVWLLWPSFPPAAVGLPALLGWLGTRMLLRPRHVIIEGERGGPLGLVLRLVLLGVGVGVWIATDLLWPLLVLSALTILGRVVARRRLYAAEATGELDQLRRLLASPLYAGVVTDVERAALAMWLGEDEASAELLRRALSWWPQGQWGRGLAVLAEAHRRLGDLETAASIAESSVRVAPHEPWGYEPWGEARLERGEVDADTLGLLERAVELGVRQVRLRPPIARWTATLAWGLAAAGQQDRARKLAAEVRADLPESPSERAEVEVRLARAEAYGSTS